MISRARLKASRINGRKCKRPRSRRGKLRSSQNAIKHGLRAKKLAPRRDDHQYEELVRTWLGRDVGADLLSAVHEIIDAQLALKAIHSIWDLTLANREGERVAELQHAELTSRLETHGIYARRARTLQRKAVAQYKIAIRKQEPAGPTQKETGRGAELRQIGKEMVVVFHFDI